MFQLMHLMFDLLEMPESGECRFVYGRAGLKVNMLGQQSQTHAARANDVAAIGLLFVVVDESKIVVLPEPLCHEAHVLTRIHLQRSATQNILRAV